MNLETHSDLLDMVSHYLDHVGILHRFDNCFTFSETSSVMIFSVFIPITKDIEVVKMIPHHDFISEINILVSCVPNIYYLEVIYPLV